MVILSEIGAEIVRLHFVEGKSEYEIETDTKVPRISVHRIIARFRDNELPVIMGVNYHQYTKGFIRDCVIKLLQNAELVRELQE